MERKSSMPTFLSAPLHRVLRRVADDAPIDATIDLVSSFATGREEALQLLRDVKAERSKLRSVLEVIRCLLADAEHKAGHQPVVGSWLGEVRDAIWDAEDVLDEYATDAAVLHRRWEDQKGNHLNDDFDSTTSTTTTITTTTTTTTTYNQVWDTTDFSEKLKAYQFDRVRCRLEDVVEDGKQLGLQVAVGGGGGGGGGIPFPPHIQRRPVEHIPPAGGSSDPHPDSDSSSSSQLLDDVDHHENMIRLKYERLAPNLKECFAYCSLFPQGHAFEKDELVHLWMAQGFLIPGQSDHIGGTDHGEGPGGGGGILPGVEEDRGRRHLEELLSLSLLERSTGFGYDVSDSVLQAWGGTGDASVELAGISFVMRDPVRDVAASVSQDHCIICTPDDQELAVVAEGKIPADRVRHLSRVVYNADPPADQYVSCAHEKLRTLILSGPSEIPWPSAEDEGDQGPPYSKFERFLDQVVFAKFRRLRALRFMQSMFQRLPASIDNLKHLRLLDLFAAPITELPESVGNLYNLQVLDIGGCLLLKEVPRGLFRNLTNLRFLGLAMSELRELPESLGDCRSLRVLDLSTSRSFEELPESLGNLTNLVALRAGGTQIKRVPDGVGNLRSLRFLHLSATFEELPESLGDLRDLQVLKVGGGDGMLKKLPGSLCNLTNLTHLNLAHSGLRELPGECLFNLPRLQEINLTGLEESLPEGALNDDAIRRLVNEKGVVLEYYGRHTSIPSQPPPEEEEGDEEEAAAAGGVEEGAAAEEGAQDGQEQ